MKNSSIEWTDHTFNPWIGCTKVSPGCANCYAEALNKRWKKGDNWGKGAPRVRTSSSYWKQPLQWDSLARLAKEFYMAGMADDEIRPTIKPYVRPRVFSASLADWLDDEVPAEWRRDLLSLIRATPNLDWLLLTKRPGNFYQLIAEDAWNRDNRPDNVWIGTTVEDQERADERIPKLLEIPARIHFLSCEPLLGPVTIPSGIDWVICGGESGPGARPMHPAWSRSLRDQCAAAGVPFHFKQWGEWQPYKMGTAYCDGFREAIVVKNGDGPTGWPTYRVGKSAAGRLLDGIEHNEVPA